MKRITLTFLTVLTTVTFAVGQIPTTQVELKVEQTDNTHSESTKKFLGQKVKKYLEREQYLIGKVENSRK